MRTVRKFVRLSAARRMLLVRAALLLIGVRVALWVLPWRSVVSLLRRGLDAGAPPFGKLRAGSFGKLRAGSFGKLRAESKHRLLGWGFSSTSTIDDLVWAVHAAARRIPGATCLTQALALHALLVRHGFPSRVQIGVSKQAEGAFRAHAWVEHNGRAVLGRREMATYTPLLTIGSPSQ